MTMLLEDGREVATLQDFIAYMRKSEALLDANVTKVTNETSMRSPNDRHHLGYVVGYRDMLQIIRKQAESLFPSEVAMYVDGMVTTDEWLPHPTETSMVTGKPVMYSGPVTRNARTKEIVHSFMDELVAK